MTDQAKLTGEELKKYTCETHIPGSASNQVYIQAMQLYTGTNIDSDGQSYAKNASKVTRKTPGVNRGQNPDSGQQSQQWVQALGDAQQTRNSFQTALEKTKARKEDGNNAANQGKLDEIARSL